jgi:hypothetical protein
MSSKIDSIQKAGGTQEKLKAKFDKPYDQYDVPIKNLVDSQRSRMNAGASRSLMMARFWRAIDRTYDATFHSCSYSLVRDMMSRNASQKDVLSAMKEYGLPSNGFMIDELDANGKVIKDPITGDNKTKFDFPAFIDVVVPLASYYHKIRASKVVADTTGVHPLYKYEPAALSQDEKLKCEIVTGVIEQQNGEMGYRQDEVDAIDPMLKYGQQVAFPLESYYREVQPTGEGEGTETVKEGVRWYQPHPSRWFVDQSDPLYKINTDTGVRWGGYWSILKYRDISESDAYWNKSAISINSKHWYAMNAWDAYAMAYPCHIKRPSFSFSTVSKNDRESGAFSYSTLPDDSGVPVTVFYDWINPKKLGLYNYDGYVWHRFMYAGDTVIHVEPFPYTPMIAYLYDNDSRRERNPGLGMELMPFQDHIQNIMSQYLLSARQNLARITFYNEQMVTEGTINALKNYGEKKYRDRMLVPFKQTAYNDAQQRLQEMFYSPEIPHIDTSEMIRAMNTMISIMERMLGYTPQEVGAPAKHEQSATEVTVVDSNASTRIRYTETAVYAAMAAKKRVLYQAFINYGSDEVIARVAEMNSVKAAQLEKMGFKVEYDGSSSEAGVSGSKSDLEISKFSNTRDGEARVSDGKVAAAMINVFQMVFSNAAFVEQVGPKQLLQRFNELLNWAGVPGQWRFDAAEVEKAKPEEQAAAAEQQAAQMADMIKQTVGNELGSFAQSMVEKVITPINEKQAQTDQAIKAIMQGFAQQGEQTSQRIDDVAGAVAGLMQSIVASPPPPPSAIMRPSPQELPADIVQVPVSPDEQMSMPLL